MMEEREKGGVLVEDHPTYLSYLSFLLLSLVRAFRSDARASIRLQLHHLLLIEASQEERAFAADRRMRSFAIHTQ